MPEFPGPSGSSLVTTLGADTATSRGIAIASASLTDHVKGDPVEIVSATPHDATWISLTISGGFGSYQHLVDIMVGASGSEVVLIADLLVPSLRSREPTGPYYFPVFIPRGTRLSARVQTGHDASFGGTTVNLTANIGAGSLLSSVPAGSTVTTYGADPANSRGTLVDPGGTAHTKGAWSEIVSATTRPHNWLVLAVESLEGSLSLTDSFLMDIGIGGSGSEQVIVGDLFAIGGSDEDQIRPSVFCFPVSIPIGTRLAVRAQSSTNNATNRLFYAALYGA